VSPGVQFYFISLYSYIIKETLSQSIDSLLSVLSCEKKIPTKTYKRDLKHFVENRFCTSVFPYARISRLNEVRATTEWRWMD